MGRNAGRGPLPMTEQEESFSLPILAYFYFSCIDYINRSASHPYLS
jgi:hypothetical protein